MAVLARTLVLVVCLSGAVFFGYWQLSDSRSQRIIDDLRQTVMEFEEELAEKQDMLARLSRSKRMAHLNVLEQTTDRDAKVLSTKLELIELDEGGSELARQQFTVPGDVVYLDTWTVKFEKGDVAVGHPLRGRTLVLLRRIFSEQIAPQEGTPIDTPGAIPPGYATEDAGLYEQQIWQHFWEIATDANLAQEMGVRVAQGEAVYKPVRTGQRYQLEVDDAGGISLTPLPVNEPSLSRAG